MKTGFHGKRGFTLVEVIVILVLLAILAAVLIPSLTTYIDRARQEVPVAHARAAYVSLQVLLSARYGEEAHFDGSGGLIELTDAVLSSAPAPFRLEDVLALAQIPADPSIVLRAAYSEKADITDFIWEEQLGGRTFRVRLQPGGSWQVAVS